MANVGVEKGNGERTHRVSLARSRSRDDRNGKNGWNGWDPLRTMREMIRWEGGENFFAPLLERVSSPFAPTFDVKETKEAYEYRAEVPGVEVKDLEVKITSNQLTVAGKRQSEKKDEGEEEKSFSGFTRRFKVPAGADSDSVQARLKDGVLRIVIQKRMEGKPRSVPIKTT